MCRVGCLLSLIQNSHLFGSLQEPSTSTTKSERINCSIVLVSDASDAYSSTKIDSSRKIGRITCCDASETNTMSSDKKIQSQRGRKRGKESENVCVRVCVRVCVCVCVCFIHM